MNAKKLIHTRNAVNLYDRETERLEAELDLLTKLPYDTTPPSEMQAANKRSLEIIAEIETLDKAVGIAFGEDTRGLNNPETCRDCVRAGPKVPAPGMELSFVRRMLARESK